MRSVLSIITILFAILLLTTLPVCGGSDDGDPNEGEAEGEGEGEAEGEEGEAEAEAEGETCVYRNMASASVTLSYRDRTINMDFANTPEQCPVDQNFSCNLGCVMWIREVEWIQVGFSSLPDNEESGYFLVHIQKDGMGEICLIELATNSSNDNCQYTLGSTPGGRPYPPGELSWEEQDGWVHLTFHVEHLFEHTCEDGRFPGSSSGVADGEAFLPLPWPEPEK